MPNHRKPDALHKLHGTFRKDRHGGGPSWPVDDNLDPSIIPDEYESWFHDHGREFWHRTAPVLHSLGLLTELDLTAFALMAHLYGQWRELSERLDKEGLIIEFKRGLSTVKKPHPLLGIRDKTAKLLFSIMEQFGMSPKSRKSLGVVLNDKTDSSKLKYFMDPPTC